MAVTLDAQPLSQYYRFSLYNSPFVAHDEGCAIDLYPEAPTAPSPVAGTVLDTKTVRAPQKPYAAEHDHLLLIDTGDTVARLLHVDPTVEPGESIAVGDDIGRLVRAGFFAPWVPNHIHLGFRAADADPYRAAGSLPVEVGVDVDPLSWDGTGRVVETGETWARLDSPTHPAPGERFVGLANAAGHGVVDGGFPHYEWGGLLGTATETPVSLAGHHVGVAEGRTVAWDDVTVRANGESITGLALFCSRDDAGVKLVGETLECSVGEDVVVTIS